MKWHKIHDFLKRNLPWIFLILGLLSLYLAHAEFLNDTFHSIFERLTEALLVGGLLGFLVNSARFVGLFKEELEDVIYGKDFVGKRKDLVAVWTNLSLFLFKEKFPQINQQLVSSIKQAYLSDDIVYYKDYEYTIHVEWINKTEKTIKITESMFFHFVSHTKGKVPLYFDCNTFVSDQASSESCFTVLQYLVDGVSITPNEKRSYDKESKVFHYSSEHSLSGKNDYEVRHKREKIVCLADDTDLSFYARHLIHNMEVTINYPSDLKMYHRERGTINSFKPIHSSKGFSQLKYEGIILRKQGIVMVFIP